LDLHRARWSDSARGARDRLSLAGNDKLIVDTIDPRFQHEKLFGEPSAAFVGHLTCEDDDSVNDIDIHGAKAADLIEIAKSRDGFGSHGRDRRSIKLKADNELRSVGPAATSQEIGRLTATAKGSCSAERLLTEATAKRLSPEALRAEAASSEALVPQCTAALSLGSERGSLSAQTASGASQAVSAKGGLGIEGGSACAAGSAASKLALRSERACRVGGITSDKLPGLPIGSQESLVSAERSGIAAGKVLATRTAAAGQRPLPSADAAAQSSIPEGSLGLGRCTHGERGERGH
jgi:hypothetical protein